MTHDNVTDIVERLNADADRWMAGDVGRDNEEAGLLSDEAADTIATLRKQLSDAREALVKNQWELETIDRTQSTNFMRVKDLILANREALKGQP